MMTEEKFLFNILRGINAKDYTPGELLSLLLAHKFIVKSRIKNNYTVAKSFVINTTEFNDVGRWFNIYLFFRLFDD